MSLEITEDLIARQSPEAQAIIRMLLKHIAEQDQQIADLKAEVTELKAELKGLLKAPQFRRVRRDAPFWGMRSNEHNAVFSKTVPIMVRFNTPTGYSSTSAGNSGIV